MHWFFQGRDEEKKGEWIMKNIKILVDNDMINNPFWEVEIDLALTDQKLTTSELIGLASGAQPKVDKIVVIENDRHQMMFKQNRNGVIGWNVIILDFKNGRKEHWFSCEDLEVRE